MSGGSPQTTVSNNGPPQVFLDAYGRVVDRAEGVSQTPYERYPGNLVAPFSPDQLAAMNIVRSSQGINAPYINQAADYIDQSTGDLLTGVPQMSNTALGGVADQGLNYIDQAGGNGILDAVGRLSPDSILPWMSPYTDEVVTATQDDFARSNEQQRQGLVGNAISRGAWGGDRSAVAEGILAGEQQRVQAPVLAGLRDRGFQTGLGAAQNAAALGLQGATADATQKQQAAAQLLGLYTGQQGLGFGANQAEASLAQQAGYGMAGLGREAQTSTLAGAQALSGIGGMQQEQAQRQLNVPYEQFLAEQQYPFQTTGWLSNIASGLGGAAGGTTTTTAPGPSALSQIGGLGLSAAGIIGGTGGFGSNGWLSGLFGGGGGGGGLVAPGGWSARGGEIPSYASGGGIAGDTPFDFPGGFDVPDLTISVVPGAHGIDVAAMPGAKNKTPNIMSSTGTTTQTEGGGGGLGGILGLAGTAIGSMWGPAGAMIGGAAGRTVGSMFGGADGGGVPEVTTRPGVRAGSAIPRLSWGAPGMGAGLGAAIVPAAGGDPVAAYLADIMKGASYVAPKTYVPPAKVEAPAAQSIFGGDPSDGAAINGWRDIYLPNGQSGEGGGGFAGGGLIGYAAGGDLPLGIDEEEEDGEGVLAGREKPGFMAPGNPWNALLYAGLGTMAGTSSSPLANLGKGAMEGLRVYGQDRRYADSTEARRENAKEMARYREQRLKIDAARQAAQERKADADIKRSEAQTNKLIAAVGGGGRGRSGDGEWKPVPVVRDGQSVMMLVNENTGETRFLDGIGSQKGADATLRERLANLRLEARVQDDIMDAAARIVAASYGRTTMDAAVDQALKATGLIPKSSPSAASGSASPSAAPASVPGKPMPKSQKDMVVGEIYQTKRGKGRWNGTDFELVAP